MLYVDIIVAAKGITVSAKGTKMLKGSCTKRNRNKSMTISVALSATNELIVFATTGKGKKVVQKGRGLYLR